MSFFMPSNGHCGNLNTEHLSNLITSTVWIFVFILCICIYRNTCKQMFIHALQLPPQLLICIVFMAV